jgi:hypothetical protein
MRVNDRKSCPIGLNRDKLSSTCVFAELVEGLVYGGVGGAAAAAAAGGLEQRG